MEEFGGCSRHMKNSLRIGYIRQVQSPVSLLDAMAISPCLKLNLEMWKPKQSLGVPEIASDPDRPGDFNQALIVWVQISNHDRMKKPCEKSLVRRIKWNDAYLSN